MLHLRGKGKQHKKLKFSYFNRQRPGHLRQVWTRIHSSYHADRFQNLQSGIRAGIRLPREEQNHQYQYCLLATMKMYWQLRRKTLQFKVKNPNYSSNASWYIIWNMWHYCMWLKINIPVSNCYLRIRFLEASWVENEGELVKIKIISDFEMPQKAVCIMLSPPCHLWWRVH